MTTMLEKFKAVAERNNEQIKRLQQESAELVKPLLQDFVSSFPEVKQIKWAQYTPYFNDGEPCEFGLHGFGFYFEGDDLSDGHWDHELYEYGSQWFKKRDVCSQSTFDACCKLEKQLNGIKDALQTIFGDHVQVTVSAKGVEVEEYDHD